ncbi:MAG: GNAT family N-acetyltransferase [Clostridia bacterium]|nr:GNAT family N-acetyltransferase [Clostridia bacterium]
MLFAPKTVTLKNGITATLRAPRPEEAAEMLAYLQAVATETHFLLRYPEECSDPTDPAEIEEQARHMANALDNPYSLSILCEVDGKIAGQCSVSFNRRFKISHRATIAITSLSPYWGIGLGTAMFAAMEEAARAKGITQLELGFMEGNTRARALYEKMGFRIVGDTPGAFRLKDGTLLKEYHMVKEL